MKTARKALAIALCAILLVTASVMGTLAYLTSTDDVTNTFTVGNVAIHLDETDVDNSKTGTIHTTGRDQGNAYHLMPGETYTKDPVITVEDGSEDCYLFVKVENDIADLEAEGNTIAAQMEDKGWVAVEGAENVFVNKTNGARTVYQENATATVFESFKLADDAVVADRETDTIVITAYAIQVQTLEQKTDAEIWNLFNA